MAENPIREGAMKFEDVIEVGLTVKQLCELLSNCDPDAKCFFTCSYGDYHDTMQAIPVEEVLELTSDRLHESGYSQSRVAIDLVDDPDEDQGDGDPIIVFR